MSIDRRDFLKMTALSGGTLLGYDGESFLAADKSAPPASLLGSVQPPLPNFELLVKDGYAHFIDKTAKSVVLGAVDHKMVRHPLVLWIPAGKITPAMPLPSVAPNQWDCSRCHIELVLPMGTTSLVLPSDGPFPNPMKCPQTSAEWNNLMWLPSSDLIYPGSPVKADWAGRLQSRFKLTQGTLTVGAGYGKSMWRFRNPVTGRERWAQPMSNSISVSETLAADAKVLLQIYDVGTGLPKMGRTPNHEITIEADNGVWSLQLAVKHGGPPPATYQNGDVVQHFSRYRDLLDVAGNSQILPYVYQCEEGGGGGGTPGDFCPYMRIDV